jgi:hypothetical protein
VRNQVTVHWLPLFSPSEAEQANPARFVAMTAVVGWCDARSHMLGAYVCEYGAYAASLPPFGLPSPPLVCYVTTPSIPLSSGDCTHSSFAACCRGNGFEYRRTSPYPPMR